MDPLLKILFENMAGIAQWPGSCIAAHLPTLHVLASEYGKFGPVVECGVNRGSSTIALLSGARKASSRLVSFDINAECENHVRSRTAPDGLPDWEFRKEDAALGGQNWSGAPVGLFFLDTTHTYEATKSELTAWNPRMHPSGIMIGHDYYLHEDPEWANRSGVRRAVDEFAYLHRARFRLQVLPHDKGLFILWRI